MIDELIDQFERLIKLREAVKEEKVAEKVDQAIDAIIERIKTAPLKGGVYPISKPLIPKDDHTFPVPPNIQWS